MSFYCPEDPLDFCRLIGLGFDFDQGVVMKHIGSKRGTVDARIRAKKDEPSEGDILGNVFRASLMAVLWRLLRVPGMRVTLIAPPDKAGEVIAGELGALAMAYLVEVCQAQDHVLAACSRVRDWNRIEFGAEAGWEARMIPCVPSIAAEAARRSLVVVILDAGNTSPAFVESSKALEDGSLDSRTLLLRLW